MGHVIAVFVGLIATAVYAVGAAELLLGETGVDLLEAARTRVPPDALVWLTRVPLEAPEGAPAWRTIVISIALASGLAGSLFLIVKARLSAVLLWLSFLLLLGVLVGQDLVVAQGFASANQQQLITLGGTLGAALIFALIANIVTSKPREEDEPAPVVGYAQAERVRELIRSDGPPRRRSPFADPDPPPARRASDPEPAQRQAESETDPEPEPRAEARSESRPASEPTDLLQTDDLVPAKT